MRKILIGLLAVLIVLIIGVVTLVMVIDPNDYRGYITKKVKQSTGYELTLDGDLRWHIWPQISILSDGITLKDAGAKIPLLKADNMRLDVELFPLFSKQLSIKQVFVKGAVINISEDSKSPVSSTAPVTLNNTAIEGNSAGTESWQLDLNKLEIADSVIVWQQDKNNTTHFRDINLLISQTSPKQATVSFSGRVEKDQKSLNYALDAKINLSDYPKNVSLVLDKLTYNLQGPDFPTTGIAGSIAGTLNYQQSPKQLTGEKIEIVANKNNITVSLNASLDNKPVYKLTLMSDKIDLNQFVVDDQTARTTMTATKSPVIAQPVQSRVVNELAFLKDFDAYASMNIQELLFRKVVFSDLVVELENKNGLAELKKMDVKLFDGSVSAKGVANGQKPQTEVHLTTQVSQIDLSSLLAQLELSQVLTGQLNAQGDFTVNSINADRLLAATTGKMGLEIDSARLHNINIQEMIQSAVSKRYTDVKTQERYEKYTEVRQLKANAELQKGILTVTNLSADSDVLALQGTGKVNIIDNSTDLNLDVRILQGWDANKKIVEHLQKTTIPLHIYGNLDQLHYQLNIDKLLQDQLKTELNRQIDKLKEKNPDAKGTDVINSLLDKLRNK